MALLWTTLRATFLHVVWTAYYSREPAQLSSTYVVREVVAELRRVMGLRFAVATLTPDTLDALPTSFLTAQLRPAKLPKFQSIWAVNGTLCAVETAGEGAPRLELRLSLTSPVLAP